MWYKVTWALESARQQKFTELIFSYEDRLTQSLLTKLSISRPHELVIHAIEKYNMEEGTV